MLCALQRLQAKIIKLVDVSYGGENGFNQAIELAAESLQNVKFIQEKKLIGNIYHSSSWLLLLLFVSPVGRLTYTHVHFIIIEEVLSL
jgi:peptide subunit release factor 1 (eRF1)